MKKSLTGVISGWTFFCGVLVSPVVAAEPRVVVQINNLARFEQGTVAKAQEIVTGIFREIHVEFLFLNESDLRTIEGGNRSQSDLHTIRINLVASKPTTIGVHMGVVGLAALPGNGQPGVLAWVFQGTLEQTLDDMQFLVRQRNRVQLREALLGHTIAHEIGHLLLASLEHSGSGLMSLGWDLSKVRLACSGGLSFSAKEAAKIRATVQAMNATMRPE